MSDESLSKRLKSRFSDLYDVEEGTGEGSTYEGDVEMVAAAQALEKETDARILILERQVKESHDHALWEAEMMSNILLSNGSHIAISKVYFNGLFNDENYKDREPTLTTHESSTITKAKFEALEKQVTDFDFFKKQIREATKIEKDKKTALEKQVKELKEEKQHILNAMARGEELAKNLKFD